MVMALKLVAGGVHAHLQPDDSMRGKLSTPPESKSGDLCVCQLLRLDVVGFDEGKSEVQVLLREVVR
jgi:hypothetical protein